MEWPDSFHALKRGEGCPMCGEGRPEETEYGARILAGDVSDAVLQRRGVQRGYTVVIWRGSHVVEPTGLSEDEASAYWREVLRVGRALEERFEPVKLNYETHGNTLPHLHTHVMPRYADDPRPGRPFPYRRTSRRRIQRTSSRRMSQRSGRSSPSNTLLQAS